MAPTLETLLTVRASDLLPTPAQLAAAARSQNYLRSLLDTGQMGTRIQDSFLIGSYDRHTALRPLDDVDIVFIVDPSAWQTGFQQFVGSLPDPGRVLESFAAAIRYRYDQSSVRVQTRSVGLKMEHLDIDAVPAVPHPHNAAWIRVPDRNARSWIDSGPRAHSAIVTAVNQQSAGLLVPLVRLLKAWNAGHPSTTSLKGFAVETLATRLFGGHGLTSLLDGLLLFFDFVAWRGGHDPVASWSNACDVSFGWGRSIPDIAGTGHNLLAGVDGERIKKFADAARVARDAVVAARSARTVQNGWSYLDRRFTL